MVKNASLINHSNAIGATQSAAKRVDIAVVDCGNFMILPVAWSTSGKANMPQIAATKTTAGYGRSAIAIAQKLLAATEAVNLVVCIY